MTPLPTAWAPAPQPPSAVSRAYNSANRWLGAVLQRVTLPQDDAPADLLGKLVSSTPPWFISLIVHFSIMIFLGLLVLGRERGEQEGRRSKSICRTPTRKTTKSMPRRSASS